MMKTGLFQLIKRAFRNQPTLHPIDQRLAKRWIKQRLVATFPELRHDAVALEEAYRSLSLEPRPGAPDEADTVFELNAPGLT